MNDAAFKAMYWQLRDKGRGHKESLVIIARRLVKVAHAVASSGRPYDAESCFPNGIPSLPDGPLRTKKRG